MKMTITVPVNFNFWRTVYSHGWSSLPPFVVDKETARVYHVTGLSTDKKIVITTSSLTRQRLLIDIQGYVTAKERNKVIAIVKSCFRIDEDFTEFYSEARKYPRFRWIPKLGAGRMLRAQTVFEDIVKMICTTNCSWALTEIMIGNLCTKLGVKVNDASHTFPSPDAIADCTEKYLRKEIRAGYRAPYLLDFARRIVKSNIEVEAWRTSTLPTEELFKEVRSVKGVGPYAAGNILKLLGRYDYLGIDSWCRKRFFELHKNGRTTSDNVIEKYYAPFGRWRGLFFWLDVTKHWYNKKFPF